MILMVRSTLSQQPSSSIKYFTFVEVMWSVFLQKDQNSKITMDPSGFDLPQPLEHDEWGSKLSIWNLQQWNMCVLFVDGDVICMVLYKVTDMACILNNVANPCHIWSNGQCKVSKKPVREIKASINDSTTLTTQIIKMTFPLDESCAKFKEWAN